MGYQLCEFKYEVMKCIGKDLIPASCLVVVSKKRLKQDLSDLNLGQLFLRITSKENEKMVLWEDF